MQYCLICVQVVLWLLYDVLQFKIWADDRISSWLPKLVLTAFLSVAQQSKDKKKLFLIPSFNTTWVAASGMIVGIYR